MSWVTASSDSIGVKGRTYGVAKYPIRKQWALVCHTDHVIEIAAYFRTEQHARDFAAALGLNLTDHE